MQKVRPTSSAAATNALSPLRVFTCLFACVFMSCATLAQALSASNSTGHSAKNSAQGGQTSGAKGGAKGGPNGGQTGGQNGGRGGPPNGGGPETKTTSPATGKDPAIQWYATLERGLAEAKRTNKPILFVTGAPHCSGVSGRWCPGKK